MLVFLSDLHISDKTTGVQHLSRGAFELALASIAQQAAGKGKPAAKDVTFVFLGDIFDLVRTNYWFNHPGSRPWDPPHGSVLSEDSPVAQHAGQLLENTIAANQDIFDIWSQPLKGPFGFKTEPKRIYIPGNHDRICNQFEALRKRIIEVLGLNIGQETPLDPAKPFAHHYENSDYQVFARHGQEWDEYNFEHMADWRQPGYLIPPFEHYMEIPIGELIAAEVASRLPSAVQEELEDHVPTEDLNRIVEHMKTIDDVRPMAAILPWLLDSISTQPVMQKHRIDLLPALSRAINRVVADFDALPFTQQWMDKHDAFAPWDYVDRLQGAIAALKHLDVRTMDRALRMMQSGPAQAVAAVARLVPCLGQGLGNDNYAMRAHEDFGRLKDVSNALYLLYGHTHRADQVPIDTPANAACKVYLNTGTWRPLYRQALSEIGFIRWKNLTYTILYHPQDDPGSQAADAKQPIFESWTGSLLDPLI